MNLRREFEDRQELESYLRAEFPAAEGGLSPIAGGRAAAKERLVQIQPVKYAADRNYLRGAVSRLSMYIRHGVVTLAEVRDRAVGLVRDPLQVSKFVSELGWRDYYQRIYAQIGDGVWQDREAYKTGFEAGEYAAELPGEIEAGETGLACMDGFAQELRETGYLHNHARMWVAAYVVHWRKVQWQAGARWFLRHLLDGDPASNNLSWQWVASTFSYKPYFFNRENLERYTRAEYCKRCELQGKCPLAGSYESLAKRLFPRAEVPVS